METVSECLKLVNCLDQSCSTVSRQTGNNPLGCRQANWQEASAARASKPKAVFWSPSGQDQQTGTQELGHRKPSHQQSSMSPMWCPCWKGGWWAHGDSATWTSSTGVSRPPLVAMWREWEANKGAAHWKQEEKPLSRQCPSSALG